jgi:hypothetical protein
MPRERKLFPLPGIGSIDWRGLMSHLGTNGHLLNLKSPIFRRGLSVVSCLVIAGSSLIAGQLPRQTQAPAKGTPEEIERYKTELAERVKGDRRHAKRGDVLTPELSSFLVERFRTIAEGKDGAKTLALIEESNPGDLPLQVNGNYPKGAALATMPPIVLQSFPELPEGIEYRFVGCRLMLMAQDSRVVIDYTEECFWK